MFWKIALMADILACLLRIYMLLLKKQNKQTTPLWNILAVSKSLGRRSLFTEQPLSKFPYALNSADPKCVKTIRERSITVF